MGGGNEELAAETEAHAGLSPRGRGKLVHCANSDLCRGSIPAWAGETPPALLAWSSLWVYPRVGGGNEQARFVAPSVCGLSPRGRGKRRSKARPRRRDGSIPAWAGETAAQRRWGNEYKVYPRVGGGNRFYLAHMPLAPGLSPRGRGKHILAIRRILSERSIPAWAGETRICHLPR